MQVSRPGHGLELQCWTPTLAKCLRPDSTPRKRENPKGKKAKQPKNKREPLKSSLMWAGSYQLVPLGFKGSWGHLGLRKPSSPLSPTSPVVLAASHRTRNGVLALDKREPAASALQIALCSWLWSHLQARAGASLHRYLSRLTSLLSGFPIGCLQSFYWVSSVWGCNISVSTFLSPKHGFTVLGHEEEQEF